MPEDETLRPTEQIVLLTNQIQWFTTRLDKVSANLRAASAAGDVDDDHLDLDELHEQNREHLQEVANTLMEARRQLATYMNRRDMVLEVDQEVTADTLKYLPTDE